MTKNVTLRINEDLLHKARHQAIEEKKSFSRWLAAAVKSGARHIISEDFGHIKEYEGIAAINPFFKK